MVGKNQRLSRSYKNVNALVLGREAECHGTDIQMSVLSIGTTDDAQANKFIEYKVDIYFSTNASTETIGGTSFPARQLNMDLTQLPGVDRNDASENKRPFLVEGKLLARPLWNVNGVQAGEGAFTSNPNILSGRLVTTLGTDLGGLGATNDITLYDNDIKNLEPDVRQNYIMVNTFQYLKAMPGVAPAARPKDGLEVTNLLVLGMTQPNGAVYEGAAVAFRFVLTYCVPVVLQSLASFVVEQNSGENPPTTVDGILSLARNLKDTILPILGDTSDPASIQQNIYPDASRILRQN